MTAGGAGGSVLLVEPERAYSGVRAFDKLLAALSGDIRICDPYVDDKTVEVLTAIRTTCQIRLLTKNVQNPARLRRHYQAYQREYGNLEIRVHPTANLHDRYIVSEQNMYLVGQSLNGIGKKQTFIVETGSDLRDQMIRYFEQLWGSATTLA